MNKCYLSRIFKEVTGFTVTGYLHARRIQKARTLLVQGSMNISEISEAAGYENLTYFERVFRKHTGMSPLEYRNSAHKKCKGSEDFGGYFLSIQKISLEILRPLTLFKVAKQFINTYKFYAEDKDICCNGKLFRPSGRTARYGCCCRADPFRTGR